MINTFLNIDLNPFLYSLFMISGLLAGIIDSIAGGGGILTLPVLLGVGIPPAAALGTNRLQGCVSEVVATGHFIKSGNLLLKPIIPAILFTCLGSTLGSIVVQKIPHELLGKLLPILLMSVILYTGLSGRLFKHSVKKLSPALFGFVFGLSLGFYNGFFGPGTGSLWLAAYVAFFGLSASNASMYTKPANLSGNFISLLLFAYQGNIVISAGIAMSIGQVIGASIGSKLVIKKGDKLVKPLYLAVVFIVTVELFIKVIR